MVKIECIRSYFGRDLLITKGKYYVVITTSSSYYKENGYIAIRDDNGIINFIYPDSLVGQKHLKFLNCDTCIQRNCNSCDLNKEKKC